MSPKKSLSEQKEYLEWLMRKGGSLKSVYPKLDIDELSDIEMDDLDDSDEYFPKDKWSYNYEIKLTAMLEHTLQKRSPPFVRVLDNVDEKIVIAAYGSKVEIRRINRSNEAKLLQEWFYLENEVIRSFDSK